MTQNDESPSRIAPKTRGAVRNHGLTSGDARAVTSTWEELGDFIVSFGYALDDQGQRCLETRVHYSQGDQSMHWGGVARETLFEWIDQQARTFLPPEDQRSAEPPLDARGTPSPAFELVDCTLTDIRGEVPNALRASGHLRIRDTDRPAGDAQYAAGLRVTRLDTMEPWPVETPAHASAVDPWLHEVHRVFPVPPPGQYEVRLVVRREPGAFIVAESPGCRLHVEA